MNYAKAIRICRAIKGMSQIDLARKAQVDQSMISKIENGQRNPGGKLLPSIAEAFGMPVWGLAKMADVGWRSVANEDWWGEEE